MINQFVQVVFRVKNIQCESGWNLIKSMSLNLGAGGNFILPNWCDILFIGSQKKKVDNGKYCIEIFNPTRRDLSYVKTLMDFDDLKFIKEMLKPNMRLL